jgi:hypothetical protein
LSRVLNYAEIKDRAIELLKSGVIDNRSFDEIRHGESCIRAWCIRDALDRACREIEQQLPPPHHHRCVTLRKKATIARPRARLNGTFVLGTTTRS